jgi:branched-chain amino acid transport system substrate-binding protein
VRHSVGGGSSAPTGGAAADGTVKVGLVVTPVRVYAALGTDMQRGCELWLDGHGGKFGGYTV